MATLPERTKVFISYSHKDKKYLQELHVHLAPYVRMGVVDFWDDTKILPGAKWHEEIEKGLQSAKVAVLLISANFLASDFIVNNELPPLLAAAEQEGATILCVILRPSAFKDTDFAQFQAVNAPSNPLGNMTPGKRDEVWTKVTGHVRDALKRLTNENTDKLKTDTNTIMFHQGPSGLVLPREQSHTGSTIQIGQLLWNVYRVLESVGQTNHSLVVKAWDEVFRRHVAIKLLHLDAKLKNEIARQLHQMNLLREGLISVNLEHQNIGRVYHVMLDPLAIIMQWIEGTPLYVKFAEDIRMSITDVAKIGIKLADALSYAHAKDITHCDYNGPRKLDR